MYRHPLLVENGNPTEWPWCSFTELQYVSFKPAKKDHWQVYNLVIIVVSVGRWS